jgi:hypothetical protein
MKSAKALGRIAYEAFLEATNAADGEQPAWIALSAITQDAWADVAEAIAVECFRDQRGDE